MDMDQPPHPPPEKKITASYGKPPVFRHVLLPFHRYTPRDLHHHPKSFSRAARSTAAQAEKGLRTSAETWVRLSTA